MASYRHYDIPCFEISLPEATLYAGLPLLPYALPRSFLGG
jgi:hypothetical protein